jgi:hypothetical protein
MVEDFVTDVVEQLRPVATRSACAADKLRVTGRAVDAALACHATATQMGTTVAQACLDAAVRRVENRFAGAERREDDCLTSADAPALHAQMDAFVANTAAALRPTPAANRCVAAAQELQEVGSQVSKMLACHAQAATDGTAVPLACLNTATVKSLHGFLQAERHARNPQPAIRFGVSVTVLGFGNSHVVGSVTCPRGGIGFCTKDFGLNTTITLKAVPDEGQVFDHWNGAPCAGQGDLCTFTLTGAVSVTALFSRAVKLEVSTDTGGGRVTSTPPGINTTAIQAKDFPEDTEVSLAAAPLKGFAFESWRGPCTSVIGATCVVRLTEPIQVQANFVETATFEGMLSATGTQSRDFGPPTGTCTWTTTITGTVRLTMEGVETGLLNISGTQTNISDAPPDRCADGTNAVAINLDITVGGTSITGSTTAGNLQISFQGARNEDTIHGTLTFTLIPPYTGSVTGPVTLRQLP